MGIPLLFGIDAVRGHALKNGATVFPSPLAMACSWNRDALQAVGRATGAEVALDGLHWTFAPLLCVARDLRWGRVNETFGESPFLIGELASAMIRGLQGETLSDADAILACAKPLHRLCRKHRRTGQRRYARQHAHDTGNLPAAV